MSAVGKEGAAGKVGRSVTQVIASLTQMAVSKRFEGILEDGDVGSKELDRLARIARNPSAAGRQDVSRERELAECERAAYLIKLDTVGDKGGYYDNWECRPFVRGGKA